MKNQILIMEEKIDLRRKPHTEEHKLKLRLSNIGKKHNVKNIESMQRTQFKKGHQRTPEEEEYRISTLPKGEFADAWKGGISRGYGYKVFYASGKPTDKCNSCSNLTNNKYVIHHVDGDKTNNNINNLECVCYKCHNNSIHHHGTKTRFKKGHSVSEEIRKKISEKNKGKIPWNKK
jgi:hypothetical protein